MWHFKKSFSSGVFILQIQSTFQESTSEQHSPIVYIIIFYDSYKTRLQNSLSATTIGLGRALAQLYN